MRTRVALVIAFAAACGGETAEWGGTVETLPGGGRVVRNPEAGVWDGWDGAGWRLEEELRIGRVEGDGPAVFGTSTGLGSTADVPTEPHPRTPPPPTRTA